MSRVDDFLQAYKRLEANVRLVYNLDERESIVPVLKSRFGRYRDQIQSCANLRNYFQHTATVNNVYAADPREDAIRFVVSLSDMVLNRPRCGDICVRFEDIYWRKPTDPVVPSIRVMYEKNFSHVPIPENRRAVGLFNENSLFQYIANSGGDLSESLTFRDLKAYTSLGNRFEFLSVNQYAEETENLFAKRYESGKQLKLVLLTRTGRRDEPLEGILTPWDIISSKSTL